jgi:streptogramin lyase
VRYRLGEVQQEPLAQGAAPNTYYFDDDHRMWKVVDATGKAVLRLGAISGDKLAPGRYLVTGLGEVPIENGVVEFPVSAQQGEIVITPAHP